MSAGTLTLTNNDRYVLGDGTSFLSETNPGDFIVSVVGGVTYTLSVETIDDNSGLSLVSPYSGPTQSGLAWYAVPRQAMNLVTAALVAQSAEALRGLNYDKQNWQQVFSGTGTITVKLPDGTTFTGPAWSSFTTALNNKASKGANSDITSLSGLTTALSVGQGGTGATTSSGARTALELGNSATRDVGATTGTVCAGDDARLGTINNKSGGTVNGSVLAPAGNEIGLKDSTDLNGIKLWNNGGNIGAGFFTSYLQAKWYNGGFTLGPVRGASTDLQNVQLYVSSNGAGNSFNFYPDGRAIGNWQPVSDIRIKSLIETIPDPLSIMVGMRGYSWYYETTQTQGFGFMADEARKYFPGAIKTTNMTVELPDGKEVENVESVDTYGIAAALHHEAILALMDQMKELRAEIKGLKGE